jgi:hypothetical protein
LISAQRLSPSKQNNGEGASGLEAPPVWWAKVNNRKVKLGSMRKTTVLAIGITALAVWLGTSLFSTAQEKASSHRCEVAIVKWDGNDKVCVNLPGKAEILHVYDLAANRTPKEMQEEEFCLTWMANKMAKDGWELVTLDSRRLVFRRPLSQ